MLTGQCNTCNTEDCNCVCYICNKNQPETGSAIRNTRSRKQNKIDWISCNKCGQWVHPQCSAINKKDITKINKCIKANKADPNKATHQISVLSISNRKSYLTPFSNWSIKTNSLFIKLISGISRPIQIGHHHSREVTLVTQKTTCVQKKADIRQTVCQRTSKTPTQA